MKFTISRESFFESLQKVQNVVEKKNTVQILSNILLSVTQNELVVTATDLEVGINVAVPLEGLGLVTEGRVALSARNIVDIVKELPNKPVTIEKKENNWVELSCQKSTFNLVGLSADEYPPLPSFEDKNYITMSASSIRDMIDRTLFSASTDETRYNLNGVFLETIDNNFMRMVSTDGHRLAFNDKEFPTVGQDQFRDGIIIPRKGLTELRRLIDNKTESFSLALDTVNLLVKFDNTKLFIRLIDGEYPDYEQVVPKKNDRRIVMNREDFLGSLRRVSLLANEKSKGVRLNFSTGTLTISSSNPDLGEAKEELDVEYSGENIEIGFNARYIIECLSILECERVTLDLNDKLSAGLLKQFGKDDYNYVVMPMRI